VNMSNHRYRQAVNMSNHRHRQAVNMEDQAAWLCRSGPRVKKTLAGTGQHRAPAMGEPGLKLQLRVHTFSPTTSMDQTCANY